MSDLDNLVHDLGKIPTKALENVRTAVEVSARHLKDDWRDAAKGNNPAHSKQYPSSISYTLRNWPGEASAQVGPALGGQGSLGILEEANGGVASAPQRNWEEPLRAAEKDFADGLAKALGDAFG